MFVAVGKKGEFYWKLTFIYVSSKIIKEFSQRDTQFFLIWGGHYLTVRIMVSSKILASSAQISCKVTCVENLF